MFSLFTSFFSFNFHPLVIMSINSLLQSAVTGASYDDPTAAINGVLTNIITVMTGIGALVCAVGIAVGGLMRATSFGNERKISDSNTAITCAVIGLVIVLLAQTLGNWVAGLITTTPTP
jgi:hypothetical protein